MRPWLPWSQLSNNTVSWVMTVPLEGRKEKAETIKTTQLPKWQTIPQLVLGWTGTPECLLCWQKKKFGYFILQLFSTSQKKSQTVAPANNSINVWCMIFYPNKMIKGSVERSRHERHFCSLLPYFLLSWLQIFQLCLSFCTSSPDLVLFKKFLQEKEKYPKNHPKRLSS